MERRRPRRPAPHLRSLRQSRADRAAAPPRRRTVGREAHGPCPPAAAAGEDTGAPSEECPVRGPAPWSAGVLAGLRHTLRPSGSRVPTAPPYRRAVGREAHGPCPPAALAGEDTGAPCEECPVRGPAPWSAGVLAGLRHTLRRSGNLVPTAPPHRRIVGWEAHGPCPPAALAGEDTGAPCEECPVRAPAPWSAGVLAGLLRRSGQPA